MTYGQGARMALPVWAYYMQGIQQDAAIGYPASLFMKPDGKTKDATSTEEHLLDEGLLPEEPRQTEDVKVEDGY